MNIPKLPSVCSNSRLCVVRTAPCHWWVILEPRCHLKSLYILNIWTFSRVEATPLAELLFVARTVCALCDPGGICACGSVLQKCRYALMTAHADDSQSWTMTCMEGCVDNGSLSPCISVPSSQLPQLPIDRPALGHACAATAPRTHRYATATAAEVGCS